MLVENGANKLVQHKVATNLQFVKKKETEQKHLQSAIKQTAIRCNMSMFHSFLLFA